MKTSLRLLNVLLILSFLSVFTSCNNPVNFSEVDPGAVTDYSKSEHWLSLPTERIKDVDIFYVYPTSWYKEDPSEPNYCAIDNRIMLIGSQMAFNRQATAFETVGNIYAPYYRQTDAAYILSLPNDQRWDLVRSVPAKDVAAAFDYYVKHYNSGRPFILAGHSLGAMTTMHLLSDYMYKNPAVYERMISAYVIGYPVTSGFMDANTHLKFAQGPDDTGVIISFNTQSPNIAPGENIIMTNSIGLVINPINWKRDETLAPADESLGSYMPVDGSDNYEFVPNFADARIDLAQGVVICSTVDESVMFEIAGNMGRGNYHSFDIPFYYFNIRDNAEKRVNAFLGR